MTLLDDCEFCIERICAFYLVTAVILLTAPLIYRERLHRPLSIFITCLLGGTLVIDAVAFVLLYVRGPIIELLYIISVTHMVAAFCGPIIFIIDTSKPVNVTDSVKPVADTIANIVVNNVVDTISDTVKPVTIDMNNIDEKISIVCLPDSETPSTC